MKKFVALALGLSLLFGGVAWAETNIPAGMKYMTDRTGILQMVVPEKAPEFLYWQTQLLHSQKLPNGNVYLVAEASNSDETVFIMIIAGYFAEQDKIYILAFQVSYFLPEFFEGKNPDAFYSEVYVNVDFDKTGKPGTEYAKVDKDPDWDAWMNKISGQAI